MQGAREQFKTAIELGANEPEVRFELAKVLRTLGETAEAQEQLKLYQQRLKEESDKSLAILKSTQAEEAVKAGDNRKAAGLFREASAALPDNPALAYRLAVVLGELGDTAGERYCVATGNQGRSGICPRAIPAWLPGNPRRRQCRG